MICNNLVKNGNVGAPYSDLLRERIPPPLSVAVPLVCSPLAAIVTPDTLGATLLLACCPSGLHPLLAPISGGGVDALQQVVGDFLPLGQVVLVHEEDGHVLHHLPRLARRIDPLWDDFRLWGRWQHAVFVVLHNAQEELHLAQQLQQITFLSLFNWSQKAIFLIKVKAFHMKLHIIIFMAEQSYFKLWTQPVP
jgi:hypothetical protein